MQRGKIRGRGFISRLGVIAGLAVLSTSLLTLSSTAADQTAGDNYALYSGWQATPDRQHAAAAAEVKVGSFLLQRPRSETFTSGLYSTVYDALSAIPPNQNELERYLQTQARSRLTDSDTLTQTFGDYLQQRTQGIPQHLLRNSTNYLNDAFRQLVSRQATDARFLNNIELDIQTPLGERRGQSGLSALGALRESERDAIAWQLRGYVTEDSGKGANAGLIYRRAANLAGDALLGGNIFLDFEHQGKVNEKFWRWSVGGEYRNAYGDLYANYYFPITSPITREDKLYYTQEGLDVELNADILNSRYGSLAGGLGYYHWQGIRGEPDDSGLRYHLRASPDSGNLHIELQLDTPEKGSTDWGGRVSYRHFISGAAAGSRSPAADKPTFDAREYFFAPVRREYAQRIRTLIITDVQAKGLAGQARLWMNAGAAPVMLTPDAAPVVLSRPLLASLATGAGGTVELAQVKAWTASVYQNTTLRMHLGNDGTTLQLDGGNVYLTRRSTPMRVEMLDSTNNAVTIDLYGTQCYFTAGDNRSLVCDEGEVRTTLNSFSDLAMRYGGSSVTILVDYVPDGTAPESRETMTLHCNSSQSRMEHREENPDFPGCFGDAQVNMPPENNNRVEVVSDGRTLTIERRDDETIITGSGYTITVAGTDNLPISPYNLRILTPDTNGEMVEVLMPMGNTSPAIDSADLMPRMVSRMMSGGLQMANSIIITESDQLDCIPDSAPDESDVVSCGDLAFKGIDAAAPYQLVARVGMPQTVTLDVTGGSGRFLVTLHHLRGDELLHTDTAAAVDDKIILTVDAAAAGESAYRVRVEEGHSALAQASVVAPVEITIQVNAANSLSAPVQSAPFSVATALSSTVQVYSGEFSHAAGNLTYQTTYSDDAHSDKFEVTADSGGGVTVRLLDIPFTAPADVTITIVATDDADGSQVTLLVRVHVREPGPIDYYVSYSRASQVNYRGVEVPEYDRANANMSDPDAIQLYVDIYGHRGVSGGLVTLRSGFIQRIADNGNYFNTGNFRVREILDNGYRRVAVFIGDRQGTAIHCGGYRAIIRLEDEYGQQVRIERIFRVTDVSNSTDEEVECRSQTSSAFSAPLVSGPLLVYTQVPTERVIYAGEFSNASDRISYEAPVFSSHAGDFIVEAVDGNPRVAIRNRGWQSGQSPDQRPFPDEVNITISLVARDSGRGEAATLVLTVEARDPDGRELRFTPSDSGGLLSTTVESGYTWYVYDAYTERGKALGSFSSPFLASQSDQFIVDNSEGYTVRSSGVLTYFQWEVSYSVDFQIRSGVRLDHSRVPAVYKTVRIRINNPNPRPEPYSPPRPEAPVTVYTQVSTESAIYTGEFTNTKGPILYSTPRFSSHAEDFKVQRSFGNNRVVVRSRGRQPGQSPAERPFPEEVDITMSLVARDIHAALLETLVLTIHARDPDPSGLIFTPSQAGGFLRTVEEDGYTWYVYHGLLPYDQLGQISSPHLTILPGTEFLADNSGGFNVYPSGQLGYSRGEPSPSRDIQLTSGIRLDHSRVPAVSTTVRIRIENPILPPFLAPLPEAPVTVYTQVPAQAAIYTGEFSNALGSIIYEAPVFSSHAGDFTVEATDGNNRVVILNRAWQLGQSLTERPFPDEVDITISLAARESASDRRAVLVLTVHARDPDPRGLRFIPDRPGGFLRTTEEGGYTWYVYDGLSLGERELGRFSSLYLASLPAIGFIPAYSEGYNVYPSGQLFYTQASPPPSRDLEISSGIILAHSRVPTVSTTVRIRIENPNIPPFLAPRSAGPVTVYTQVAELGPIFTQVVTLSTYRQNSPRFELGSNNQPIYFSSFGSLAIYNVNRQIADEMDITVSHLVTDTTYNRTVAVVVTFHVRDPGAEAIRFQPRLDLDNGYRYQQTVAGTGDIRYVYSLGDIRNTSGSRDALGSLPFSVDAAGYYRSEGDGFTITEAGEVFYTGTGPAEVVLRPRLRLNRRHSRVGSDIYGEVRIRIIQ